MSVDRCKSRYFLLALSGLALSACSPSSSTAAPAQGPAAVVAAAAAAAPAGPLVTGLPDFTLLVEKVGPAVVNVQVTEDSRTRMSAQFPDLRRFGIPVPDMPQGGGQDDDQPSGEGSGFIVSADGYILTNRHVVADARKVKVKLTDRREFDAKVIGMDARTDVAVIKIEAANLPTVRLGDPSKLKPGQWVVAIGSPFGMDNTVTSGIVSATSRSLPNEPFVPFIQTDVAVNPGNSGGPLFNLNGEVVGINSQIYSPSGGNVGLSFAIPIDIVNDVRDQLVKTGKVVRGRIGVGIEPMNADSAESVGLERPRGARVNEIVAGEPAEKAGIKLNDVILSVDGKSVDSDINLRAMVAAIRPGSNAELEVWTDRKLRKVTVKVGEAKDEVANAGPAQRGSNRGENGAPEPDALGLSIRPLTPEEKEQINTRGSLLVVAATGPAARAGVRANDIILGVLGTNVTSVAEFKAAVGRIDSKVISLRVQRPGEGIRFLEVRRE